MELGRCRGVTWGCWGSEALDSAFSGGDVIGWGGAAQETLAYLMLTDGGALSLDREWSLEMADAG